MNQRKLESLCVIRAVERKKGTQRIRNRSIVNLVKYFQGTYSFFKLV